MRVCSCGNDSQQVGIMPSHVQVIISPEVASPLVLKVGHLLMAEWQEWLQNITNPYGCLNEIKGIPEVQSGSHVLQIVHS